MGVGKSRPHTLLGGESVLFKTPLIEVSKDSVDGEAVGSVMDENWLGCEDDEVDTYEADGASDGVR